MKKVLVVSMSAELGGIEKSLISFLNYLEKKDCEVDLLLWKKRGELLPSIPQNVHFVDNVAPGNLRKIIKERKYRNVLAYLKLKLFTVLQMPWKALQKIDKKYDIAVSYTQDGYSPYYVIDNVSADRKFLWYHHGEYQKNARANKTDQKYYELFDHVVTVSNANKQMLLKFFPALEQSIVVIPNLLNKKRIMTLAQEKCDILNESDRLRIVTVGRLVKEKGQILALEVAKIMKDNGLRFLWCFVGGGPDFFELQKKAKEYGLEKNCVFVGNQKNPYPYIANCDIYVQPSFVESEAISIREAMLFSKPIIASDIPAIRETLNGNGVCCKIDPNCFYEEICKCFDKEFSMESDSRNYKTQNDSEESIKNLLFI